MPRQRVRHYQRTGVIAAMRIEERAPAAKQRPITGRYAVAAVFAGDQKGVDGGGVLPRQFRQLAKHLSRAFAPFVA